MGLKPRVAQLLQALDDLPRWQKIAGLSLAAALAALLSQGVQTEAEAGRFFQVVDPDKGIKLRAAPCLEAEGTGHVLVPLEPFETDEVLEVGAQTFLRLADGRGWAFLRSRTGQVICQELTRAEVENAGGTALQQVEDTLKKDPRVQQQLQVMTTKEREDAIRKMARRVVLDGDS
ncbi:unnamed protein product [Effrenium voratum]|uniref:Uncharacterized protein n=1 Tax=Effrenium voratum TaxID=2562239 RepID=A0AA36J399_9DINO|nr:unnamed protein product [Effrenium voratum]CAJ1450360.1 unnamed protein product [Effrenium voratum]